MATRGAIHGADGHASDARTHTTMRRRYPPLESKNSGKGGMESVPKSRLIVSSSIP